MRHAQDLRVACVDVTGWVMGIVRIRLRVRFAGARLRRMSGAVRPFCMRVWEDLRWGSIARIEGLVQ